VIRMKLILTEADGKFYEVNTISVNINNTVYVKLTEYGESVLKSNTYSKFEDGDFNCKMKEGYYRMSLWEFMRIFGKRFYMGSQQMIVDNELFIVEGS